MENTEILPWLCLFDAVLFHTDARSFFCIHIYL